MNPSKPSPTMMHVACGANAAYLPYAGAMLHSLLSNNPGTAITVHFMHDGKLTATEMAQLADLVQGLGAQWQPLYIDAAQLAGFPVSWRFGKEAWYRTLLPALLPDVQRILYLDADTLVLRPIATIWNIDLKGCAAAAVMNPLYSFMDDGFMAGLGLQHRKDYFNSGVLLLDLERWRTENLATRIVDFVVEHGAAQNWPDQNTLNAVLRGHWLPLEPLWNAQSIYFDLDASELGISRAQFDELRSHPGIVHFVAPYKPLEFLCKHPFRERHFQHLRQTPWRDAPITGRTPLNRVLRLLPQPFMWLWLRRVRLLRDWLRRRLA